MTPEQRLASALQSSEPARTLRRAVVDLSREGYAKEQIYDCLERLLLDLRTRENYLESAEDVVLDVMDALTGWCHPEARLLSED
jgi:hypothetical protein